MARTCRILKRIGETLLVAGQQDVARRTAAAAGQPHGGNDHGVELIHVDDGHRHLGGGLTTRHPGLEKGRREEGYQASRSENLLKCPLSSKVGGSTYSGQTEGKPLKLNACMMERGIGCIKHN